MLYDSTTFSTKPATDTHGKRRQTLAPDKLPSLENVRGLTGPHRPHDASGDGQAQAWLRASGSGSLFGPIRARVLFPVLIYFPSCYSRQAQVPSATADEGSIRMEWNEILVILAYASPGAGYDVSAARGANGAPWLVSPWFPRHQGFHHPLFVALCDGSPSYPHQPGPVRLSTAQHNATLRHSMQISEAP